MKKRLLFLSACIVSCMQAICQNQFQVMVGEDQIFLYSILNSSDPAVELTSFGYKNDNCEFISVSPTVTYKGKDYKVTSIAADVFANVGVVSFDLPNTVKKIGTSAFESCTKLESIDLSNVETIGDYAFYNCLMLKSIGLSNVETIGYDVFYGCRSLESISLSKSTKTLYSDVFVGAAALAAINVEEGNENFISVDGVVYNPDTTEMLWFPVGKSSLVIEKPTKTIDVNNILNGTNIDTLVVKEGNAHYVKFVDGLFTADTSRLIRLVVKGDYELDKRIDSISVAAFYGCKNLTSIKIPETVTFIEDEAFAYCANLEKIEVDANNPVFASADGVLFDSTKKKLLCYPPKRKGEYTIPETVETIGVASFAYCTELSHVNVPNSVNRVEKTAFEYCSGLTEIVFPQMITIISQGAFVGCNNLISVVMPDSIYTMGASMFEGCTSLKSVKFPSYYKGSSLPDYMFALCISLDSVVIPSYIKSLGNYSFFECMGLTHIDISSNLQGIGNYAFALCQMLDSIFIPKTVSRVGELAFYYCSNLTIYCEKESVNYGDYWNYSNCPVVYGGEGDVAISADNAEIVNIYAANSAIVVDNANADVFVFDVMGRLVAKDMSNDQRVEMPIQRAGIYIVKVGNVSQRVVVK